MLTDSQVAFYEDMGYTAVTDIRDKVVALQQFIFTVGIVVGMDETGYEYRFCYHSMAEALAALLE